MNADLYGSYSIVSTFAAININVNNKQNKVEIQSDNSSIVEIILNRIDGGLYVPQLISPTNNVTISTDGLAKGAYLVKVNSLNGEREAKFLNIQ